MDAIFADTMIKKYVILDTETTGLERGEIVQIAVVDQSGEVLMNEYVKPVNPIPHEATRIHGITDAMVKDASPFAFIRLKLQPILTGTHVIVYNAVYDRKMLHQSAEAAGIPKVEWKELSLWHCAMEEFAAIYGDFNERTQSFRWQKLSTAAAFYGIGQPVEHTALADCLTTLSLVKHMRGELSKS